MCKSYNGREEAAVYFGMFPKMFLKNKFMSNIWDDIIKRIEVVSHILYDKWIT